MDRATTSSRASTARTFHDGDRGMGGARSRRDLAGGRRARRSGRRVRRRRQERFRAERRGARRDAREDRLEPSLTSEWAMKREIDATMRWKTTMMNDW